MTFTPAMAPIPLPSDHHVRLGLEAQIHQYWAMYSSLPTEVNRDQLVRLERLLHTLEVAAQAFDVLQPSHCSG